MSLNPARLNGRVLTLTLLVVRNPLFPSFRLSNLRATSLGDFGLIYASNVFHDLVAQLTVEVLYAVSYFNGKQECEEDIGLV